MTVHAPIPDYEAAREAMIDSQLKPEGVNDPAVLAALAKVPREQFVPEAVRPLAYIDRSLPLGDGRMLAPPVTIGLLLTQLAPKPHEKALVVGGGTGYSAAILGAMGLEVVALDSSPELVARARENGVAAVEGPLDRGCKRKAPYDLLLIDGAIEFLPDPLVEQLKDGGRCGAALIDQGITRLAVGRKAGGTVGFYSIADAAVPALPGFQRPRTFSF